MRSARHLVVLVLIYAIVLHALSLPDGGPLDDEHSNRIPRRCEHHHHHPVQAPRDARPRRAMGMAELLGTMMFGMYIGTLIDPNRWPDFSLPLAALRTLFQGLTGTFSAVLAWSSSHGKIGEFVSYVFIWGIFNLGFLLLYRNEDERNRPRPPQHQEPYHRPSFPSSQAQNHGPATTPHDAQNE